MRRHLSAVAAHLRHWRQTRIAAPKIGTTKATANRVLVFDMLASLFKSIPLGLPSIWLVASGLTHASVTAKTSSGAQLIEQRLDLFEV
jgi:hypothetical protein